MGVRCFIAIEIPGPLRRTLGSVMDTLRQSGADVKWVNSDLIHITLKFLGDTNEDSLAAIEKTLSKKVSHYPPFYIKIAGLDSFPPGRHPRVIWAGIEESGLMNALQKEVEDGMSGEGFPPEDRPFRAHITLGRVRSGRRLTELVKGIMESGGALSGEFEVRGVRLMKSELRPAGPVYTCLADIMLTGGKDVY